MGGFEGADHVNGQGLALDMHQLGGHWQQLDADHARAAAAGLHCVRESIGWRLSENRDGVIDLRRATRIAESAQRHGLQVLWTLMHYGLPDDLSLHDDRFIARLARFAAEVARVIGRHSPAPPVFTPVNEISFLSWAAAQPGMLHPPNHTPETDDASRCARGYAVKRRLVKATLAAMQAMREVEPRCRFLQVEPLIHVAPPADRPELADEAQAVAQWQWQAWDMLSGRDEPDCGGHPQALDLLGLNHYHHSQWELHSGQRLSWEAGDHRRRPLADLLQEVWRRYRRPLLVAETSHVGRGREHWLHETAAELRQALQAGVPLLGACLYPLLDRPDWGDTARWHRSGLWHVDDTHPEKPRLAEPGYAHALQQWQQVLPQPAPGVATGAAPACAPPPLLLVFTHMRWDFIAHRTRHLMQHLAAHWRVVVVEEPLPGAGPSRLQTLVRGPCTEVLVPHLAESAAHGKTGFADGSTCVLHELLQSWLQQRQLKPAVAWLSTPMALGLVRALSVRALVYDCGDELGGFSGAPPELPRLEAELLRSADVVLAASSSLARSRACTGQRVVHHVGNGVQRWQAVSGPPGCSDWAAWEARQAQGHLNGPRLGYAGVMDERLDTALLDALAQARPNWQFIMLGPVLKIPAANLPCRPNIHWLGEQASATIPAFMAGWHLGLIPFVEHALTTRSHPLKALEYLSAGLPVVSTPIHDLVPLNVAGLVLAPDTAGFLQRCEEALSETHSARLMRKERARKLMAYHTWDVVAEQVQSLIGSLQHPF